MSDVFLAQLDLPKPDVFLGVGSGTHAEQTARALVGIEGVLLERRPDLVVVPGDVNSTLAGALAAVKLDIPVAHLEAGLRSYDRTDARGAQPRASPTTSRASCSSTPRARSTTSSARASTSSWPTSSATR